ncbi:MAG TPA: helix-turn-helix transcriptional regulator [Micromonosporaceae bacterium]|jgi:DNA-binding CsgD family transcriptional regulator
MWGETTFGEASRGSSPEPSVARVMSCARSEILLVEPGGDARWPWTIDLAPLMAAAVARGCQVRVLFGRLPSATSARLFARRASAAGAELRAGGAPDQTMMAVDATAALLPSDGADVTMVTQPQVVRMLRGFADVAWSRATAIRPNAAPQLESPARIGAEPLVDTAGRLTGAPLGETAGRVTAAPLGDRLSLSVRSRIPLPVRVDPASDSSHRSLQQRIVQLLADGAKDETIARALGMSVRTCRRHIADIMRRLDAVSRFQAGANAVRLGFAGIESVPQR